MLLSNIGVFQGCVIGSQFLILSPLHPFCKLSLKLLHQRWFLNASTAAEDQSTKGSFLWVDFHIYKDLMCVAIWIHCVYFLL